MRKLLIVGAGSHGRCCLGIAREMKIFDEISFLDDYESGNIINDCQVIGTTEEMSSYYLEYTKIFIAIGNSTIRKKLMLLAKEIGFEVVNLVSSDCCVSKYANIANGCVIFPFAVIEANVTVDEGCVISANAVICHDAHIGNYSLIRSKTVIDANRKIDAFSKCKYSDDSDKGKKSPEYSFVVGV